MRLHSNEGVVIEHQFQQLVDSRLRETDQSILAYFTELESALLKTPIFNSSDNRSINATKIRQHIRRSPYVESIFILDTEGILLFPSALSGSLKEQQFIEKTQSLWSNMEAFQPETPSDINSIKNNRSNTEKKDQSSFSVSGALSKLSSRRQTKNNLESPYQQEEQSSSSVATPSPIASSREMSSIAADTASALELHTQAKKKHSGWGWTVWRTGTQTQTFFWFWSTNNQLVGLKLSTSHWQAELINQLPDKRNAQELLGEARIKLVNDKQTIIYQWGDYEDSLDNNFEAKGQRLLGPPLDGWRLAYFSPQKSLNDNLQWAFYLTLICLFGLVLVGLGTIIFREYRRDMRIAEQRVTFVNQVSHELKTPLTNICMYAELLESQADEENFDPSKVRKYTKVLTTESQRLGRLINNVLSFSRSQQKQYAMTLEQGCIDETIQNTADMFKPAFASKSIQLKLDLHHNTPVFFDANALEQIINNLLGNIEKYAYHGQYARITSSRKDDMTHISVEDKGSGIDSKMLPRLFEPFYRGSSELTEGVSGTGIGLSIARELCQLHGGDLTLDTQIKTGACFIITIKTPMDENTSLPLNK